MPTNSGASNMKPNDREVADTLKEYCQELSMEKLQIAVRLKLARNRIEELQEQLRKVQEENVVLNERFALLRAGLPGGAH